MKIFTELEVMYDGSITATEGEVLLRKWQKENIDPKIVQLAAESGHTVVSTPPHFSDLQPIELLWARIKGRIAKSYSTKASSNNVWERL